MAFSSSCKPTDGCRPTATSTTTSTRCTLVPSRHWRRTPAEPSRSEAPSTTGTAASRRRRTTHGQRARSSRWCPMGLPTTSRRVGWRSMRAWRQQRPARRQGRTGGECAVRMDNILCSRIKNLRSWTWLAMGWCDWTEAKTNVVCGWKHSSILLYHLTRGALSQDESNKDTHTHTHSHNIAADAARKLRPNKFCVYLYIHTIYEYTSILVYNIHQSPQPPRRLTLALCFLFCV